MPDRRYEVRVTGRLSQRARDAFAGMDVTEVTAETVISGTSSTTTSSCTTCSRRCSRWACTWCRCSRWRPDRTPLRRRARTDCARSIAVATVTPPSA